MKTITATDQQYFYHPDLPIIIGMGSSSFITDVTGDAHQHLQYLPYGEDFISQRIDWQTRYTFSAKEKDKNTGYHYFGARYYDSENSVWLSVDPMADKYPSISPFAYCYNNPLNYFDLWGLEGIKDPKGREGNSGTGYKQTADKKFLYGEGLKTKVWDPDVEVGAHVGIKGGYVDYEGDPIDFGNYEKEAANSGGDDGLKLNSTNTFVYDGTWKVDPLTHTMQAGQHVRVEVKNMNILGVQLDLQDKTFYHYEKTWLGTQKQVYSGDSYSFALLPYQTKTFDFYRFDYVPMNWTFELGTTISGAANVQIRFYSDWVPGMPYDPNHPNR